MLSQCNFFKQLVLQQASNEYSKKQQKQSGSVSDKCMFGLAWNVHELDELNSTGKKLLVKIAVLSDKLKKYTAERQKDNVTLKVTNVRNDLTRFVKYVTRRQHTAATHCLVVMISTEERNRKQYALPIQCIPYKSLKDSGVRDIGNKVIQKMHKWNIKVAGMYLIACCFGITVNV